MHIRYMALFGMLAAGFGGLAALGMAPWLMLWCGLTFLLMAIVYGLRWPGLFAKTRWWRPVATIGLLPYHGLMHVSWHLAIRRSSPPFSAVGPGLWLGRWPRRGQLPDGVERLVDLTAEMPVPPDAGGLDYHCLPTLDRTAPSVDAARQLLDQLMAERRPTLVHCAMGHGRSPVIVIAVLMRAGAAYETALAQVKRTRPRVRLTEEQAAAARQIGAT